MANLAAIGAAVLITMLVVGALTIEQVVDFVASTYHTAREAFR